MVDISIHVHKWCPGNFSKLFRTTFLDLEVNRIIPLSDGFLKSLFDFITAALVYLLTVFTCDYVDEPSNLLLFVLRQSSHKGHRT